MTQPGSAKPLSGSRKKLWISKQLLRTFGAHSPGPPLAAGALLFSIAIASLVAHGASLSAGLCAGVGFGLAGLALVATQRFRKMRSSLAELEQLMHQLGESRAPNAPSAFRASIPSVATAFTAMAERLSRRFNALDRSTALGSDILSSLDAGHIVGLLLERLPELCPCESLSVVIRRRGSRAAESHVRRLGEGEPSRQAASVGEVDPGTLRELRRIFRSETEVLIVGPGDERLAELRPVLRSESRAFSLFPLFFKRDLLGMLALGHSPGEPADAELTTVRAIANQLAVALAHLRTIEEVRFLAYYDELTGLPNRVLCTERIGYGIGRAQRRPGSLAVLFIDLDHFKRVNDSVGHDHGDDLMRSVGVRLSRDLEPHGTLSRVGGDEFVAVLEDGRELKDIVQVARRVLDSLTEPFSIRSREVYLSASIGIAVYPQDGEDADLLLEHAYAAACQAKAEGRRDFRFYQRIVDEDAADHLVIESRLRKALEARELELHFQPLVDARTGRITGAEALTRWFDAELGQVSPADFITVAEERSLIVPLGQWTLETATQQLRAWADQGLRELYVSVNVSPRQFRDRGFLMGVREALSTSRVDPRLLVLEITENVLLHRTSEAIDILKQLKATGVGVSIDDFGTGYSSLSYLKHLPVDCLKIDQAFVRGIGQSHKDEGIISAILALARVLDLLVVAEGVETDEQRQFLRAEGCDLLQGYLFGHPAPSERMTERIIEDRERRDD